MDENTKKKVPISLPIFEEWLKRDLVYLEGVAAGLDDWAPSTAKAIRGKCQGIRNNLKGFMEYCDETTPDV